MDRAHHKLGLPSRCHHDDRDKLACTFVQWNSMLQDQIN